MKTVLAPKRTDVTTNTWIMGADLKRAIDSGTYQAYLRPDAKGNWVPSTLRYKHHGKPVFEYRTNSPVRVANVHFGANPPMVSNHR